jgi:hypothetical protein
MATRNHQNPGQQLKPFATIKHPLQPSTHGNPKLPADPHRQPLAHNRPIKPTLVKLRHPNPSIATNRKTQTIKEPTIKLITVDHPTSNPPTETHADKSSNTTTTTNIQPIPPPPQKKKKKKKKKTQIVSANGAAGQIAPASDA